MCDCIEHLNGHLAEHNGQLTTNLLNPTYVFVDVVKLDPKKRKKPPHLVASHCPFCGVKYENTGTFAPKEPTNDAP